MSKTEGSDTVTMEFTYNHAGLRTKKVKKVNGTVTETTEYILNGKNVVELIHTNHATSVTNRLHFFYDTQDKQAMVEFNGVKYSYAYNLQGDVIGIIDSTGNTVVQYSYDAWGKPIGTTASSTLTTELAELNPFRYRAYVWDKETELYYLESRYYSATLGRFISADEDVRGTQDPLSHNVYVYCLNQPVDRTDESGTWSLPNWAKVAIGVALVVTAAVVATVATGGTAVACFAAGAAAGAAKGAVVGAIGGAISGAISHRIETGSWDGALEAAVDGAADGFLTGAVVGFVAGGITSQACFVAGTLIATEHGLKPIEEIEAGQMVWAEDPDTGERALKRVVHTFRNEKDELVHVTVNGEEIVCTTEHPFYVHGKGWVAAKDLQPNDNLELQKGGNAHVEAIQFEKLERMVSVYNFEVEEFHTYYVGNKSVLVHNTCHHNSSEWKKIRRNYWKEQAKIGGNDTWYKPNKNNLARMAKGKAPIGHDLKKVVLHHVRGIANNMDDIVEIGADAHRAFHGTFGYKNFIDIWLI